MVLVMLSFVYQGCGLFYPRNKSILRGDDCKAPGLEWMEAVEGYDKQEVIDLATKFALAAQVDAKLIKNASGDVSIVASLRDIARNTSGKTVKVSQEFYVKANAYRATICNIERWLKEKTISDSSTRVRAENSLISLSEAFDSIVLKGTSLPTNGQQPDQLTGGNVVSLNQSGEQTTRNIINERPTARTIKGHRDLVIQELKRVEPIDYDIQALMNDMESYNLACEIKSAMDSAGWRNGQIIRGLGGVYPQGFGVAYDKPTSQSETITAALVDAGLFGGICPDWKQQKLEIFIGPNPDNYAEPKPKLEWVRRKFIGK